MCKPRVVNTLGEVCSLIHEEGKGDNTFNLDLTPSSRISRLCARVFSSKGLKRNYIFIGGTTPDHISVVWLQSLRDGQIHHLIGMPTLLSGVFQDTPAPPYLEKHGRVNLWLIEPELMDDIQIDHALSLWVIAKRNFSELEKEGKKTKIKPDQKLHFMISKEMLNFLDTHRQKRALRIQNVVKERARLLPREY